MNTFFATATDCMFDTSAITTILHPLFSTNSEMCLGFYLALLFLWILLLVTRYSWETDSEMSTRHYMQQIGIGALTIVSIAISTFAGMLIIIIGSSIIERRRKPTWMQTLRTVTPDIITSFALLLTVLALHSGTTAALDALKPHSKQTLLSVKPHSKQTLLNNKITQPSRVAPKPATDPLLKPTQSTPALIAPWIVCVLALVYIILDGFFLTKALPYAERSFIHRYHDRILSMGWKYATILLTSIILDIIWSSNPWILIFGSILLIFAQRPTTDRWAWAKHPANSTAVAYSSDLIPGPHNDSSATRHPSPPSQESINTHLIRVLEANARWVVLIEHTHVRIITIHGITAPLVCNVPDYLSELQHQEIRQFDAQNVARLHLSSEAHWNMVLMAPLTIEGQVIGGMCFAYDQPITITHADRQVLLAFAAQTAAIVKQARLFEGLNHQQHEHMRSSKLAALSTFSSGIAHEFNNLLANILTYAEVGIASSDSTDKDEALEVALRSCLRGRTITEGLLTFACSTELQHSIQYIDHIVEEVIALVEHELARLNIQIQRCFQPIPATICDRGQLVQMVLNLIHNARDATLEQGSGIITIALCQRGDQIELTISDTGIGIPEELRDQVFHPFMTTKGARGGTTTAGVGLGLAISQGIVRNHGGTIAIESQLGHGTQVIVQIPIVHELPMQQALNGQPTS